MFQQPESALRRRERIEQAEDGEDGHGDYHKHEEKHVERRGLSGPAHGSDGAFFSV